MVVVLSEDSFVDPNTINGRELRATVEAARMFGCRIYPIPVDFEICETAENALAYLPPFDPPVPGIWAGYIPAAERYRAIYDAAAAKGVRLINTPAEYQTAMEFDKFYPLLGDLTPDSIVLSSIDEFPTVEARLGFPVFVKGTIKSNKDQGWAACVAHDSGELEAIGRNLLSRERRSRGKIIARRLVSFRAIDIDKQSFPIGREYRVFVHGGDVLAYGFYWDEYRDTFGLGPADEAAIKTLSIEAARRVGTPFIAVDIGQLEDGRWIVIEVSDGQFAGLSHVTTLELWSKLSSLSIKA
ncbi:MAG: ATP-grasp domain-containing protein [Xanthobacteraceae bacterium]|nr:ATP-grasp domain-containing protein [Xanthobacteraceae bacterium]